LIVYESLNNGDLHEYLILQRSNSIDFHHILIQIVSGMIYLSEKKFLHKDLSTRNIFISDNMNIKITNIARYQRKYHLDYYKLVNRLLPVRWMSNESLLLGIYSEMSDVWSFGVLLWEMFSFGLQPYHGHTNPEVIEMIRDRKLLTCPMNCSRRIYLLMCSCWEEISEQRPTFVELMRRLRQFKEKSITSSSIYDECILENQVESPIKTLMLPIVDRNSVRFEF
jgi:serine/threonine protein kinase